MEFTRTMMLTEYLETRSKPFLVTLGLLLLGLVAGVDYITSTRYVLEFSPFYVVPVAFFAWFVGRHIAVDWEWFVPRSGLRVMNQLHVIALSEGLRRPFCPTVTQKTF